MIQETHSSSVFEVDPMEAEALGISLEAYAADEGLSAHVDDILEIEAAYQADVADGRQVLIALIRRMYGEGYDTGLDDGCVQERRRLSRPALHGPISLG
jgi:hypothetical protein